MWHKIPNVVTLQIGYFCWYSATFLPDLLCWYFWLLPILVFAFIVLVSSFSKCMICIWYNCPSKKWCCGLKQNSRLRFLFLMEMMSKEHSTTLFQRRCLSLSSSFKLCISHKKGHALKALRPKGQSPLNMMHKVVHFEIIFCLRSLRGSFPQNSLSPITQKWPSKVLCFWGQLTQ